MKVELRNGARQMTEKGTESVLAKTRKLTTWLQKREIDTESLVTDDLEIRIQDEENTKGLERQSEQNATIDNSSSCEETDEIAEQRPGHQLCRFSQMIWVCGQ